MKVGRYDYPAQFGDDFATLLQQLGGMLLEGKYELGAPVASFEADFARFNEIAHAVGVNNGTDALILSFLGLGIRPGDEVITQANTFYATVAAICLVGARPRLVDADEHSFLISQPALEDAISSRTRAIVPVHLYGKPTPMDAILRIAGRHDCLIVEDAAQAHGARLRGRRVGTFGHAGTFSFHPSKNLAAAGDAGAIITGSDELTARLRMLHRLGQRKQNDHVVLGYNSKIDAIQTHILKSKLRHLDGWNEQRRAIAQRYRNGLAGLPLRFQQLDPDEEHVFHLFQVRTPHRDALLQHLVERGVDAVIRYPVPIHLQPAFAHLGHRRGEFPVAERLANELLCLPIRPNLTDGEVDYVVAAIAEFFGAVQQ